MNKIVREHDPVATLPDDLRVGFDPEGHVRVVAEQGRVLEPIRSFAELEALRCPPFRTLEEITQEIRALRDEWER